MATIKQTRAAIKKRHEAEAKAKAEAAAKEKAEATAEDDDGDSILDTFRKFFSTSDSSADAIAAIESGISEADAANKDKK